MSDNRNDMMDLIREYFAQVKAELNREQNWPIDQDQRLRVSASGESDNLMHHLPNETLGEKDNAWRESAYPGNCHWLGASDETARIIYTHFDLANEYHEFRPGVPSMFEISMELLFSEEYVYNRLCQERERLLLSPAMTNAYWLGRARKEKLVLSQLDLNIQRSWTGYDVFVYNLFLHEEIGEGELIYALEKSGSVRDELSRFEIYEAEETDKHTLLEIMLPYVNEYVVYLAGTLKIG